MAEIWVFGATGLSGKAIANDLVVGGADVVLVGRDSARLASTAESIGAAVGRRVVSGPADLSERILAEKPRVIINAVGPYGATTPPLLPACLAAGVHYVDQANELEPVQQLLHRHADARDRGVTLMTGAGFGVLATEALVIQLRGDRPPAARAVVAAVPAVQGLGSSVLASAVDVIAYGGRRYRDARLERRRLGADYEQIPVPNEPARGALAVPTGELEAAHRASGAAHVTAYSTEVPNGRLIRAVLPVASAALAMRPVRAGVQRLIGRMRLTPPATGGDVSWAYARLEWADGTRREAWLRAGDGYAFTARVAASVATRLIEGSGKPGAFTPGALFGADLARVAGAELFSSDEVGA
ncbi:hypothetical protein Mycsm_06676 (plasmid) [Mycobacterium sp. JS623]|uniref:saccharopine dehydrogenase NADP-binding domain-containing protein n=1 Tax=Mycobacterium sp. JS623 TaxID=212767 RepID=UPI0002A558B2|nr:saccharopine dehydrogenase NADP-binding domain-containing protein [Mycobacterium sp. JS623]AGB26798.1 hypothetical protein Mycsm_06676 [Mycobacterium sp. JS623]